MRSQAQLSVQRSMSLGDMQTMRNEDAAQGSSTCSMLGTFEYMSPEQKRGEDATAQSDLYAVGLMAFKLLTGQNPGVKPPSRIDRTFASGWDDFVEKALEEDHADRWQSAATMQTGLDAITTEIKLFHQRLEPELQGEQARLATEKRERDEQYKLWQADEQREKEQEEESRLIKEAAVREQRDTAQGQRAHAKAQPHKPEALFLACVAMAVVLLLYLVPKVSEFFFELFFNAFGLFYIVIGLPVLFLWLRDRGGLLWALWTTVWLNALVIGIAYLLLVSHAFTGSI